VEEGGEFLNIDVLHYDPATAAIDERAPVFAIISPRHLAHSMDKRTRANENSDWRAWPVHA